MNKQLIAIFVIFLALAHQDAFAQRRTRRAPAPDTIRANTIEVVQSYRPEIQQTQKAVLTPELPPTDTAAARMQYDVPVQTLNFTYRSQPLKPLALLGRDTGSTPFANYLKLGGGNLSTFYLDAAIGSLQGAQYESAIHLHHLSQSGTIKYQQSALSGIEATGKLHTATHIWHGSINGLRNNHYQYGYDHSAALSGYTPPQQMLTGIRLQAGAANKPLNNTDIYYQPQVSASFFTGSNINGQQQVQISAPFSRYIDSSFRVHLGVSGTYTGVQAAGAHAGTGLLALQPGVSFSQHIFSGHVYMSPTIGTGGNTHMLPDIMAAANLLGNKIHVSGGWLATLIQNNYEQFFLRNPFIASTQLNTWLLQNRRDEVYGTVRGNIGHHLTASGRVSWWQFRHMPMMINQPGDRKQFQIVTDPLVNAVSFQANIRYQVANTVALGLSGAWFNYYKSTGTHVWHEPGVELKADFQYRPPSVPALSVTAYAMVLDQIYATDITGRAVQLKTIADLGCGAEYSIISRLSVLMNINNLLNNRYQRWNYYPAYGFNIFGGLRLKF